MDRRKARFKLAPTIQNKLLAVMLIVALAPIVVFGTLAYFKSRETIINQVGERLQATSLLAMSQIDRTFGFSQENIRSWAALDVMQAVERGDPEGVVSEMLFDYQQAYGVYNTLVAVDVDGVVVAAGDTELIGISLRDVAWFERVMKEKSAFLLPLRLDPELGGYGVSIVVPIFRKYQPDKMVGVLKASLDWRELLLQVNAINVGPEQQGDSGYAVLIDADGYILAAPDFILFDDMDYDVDDPTRVYGRRWWVVDNPMLLDRLLNRPGHRYIRKGEQELLLVNMPAAEFKYIRNTGWSLVLVRDANDALKDIAFIRERAVMIGLVAALLIGLVAYVMSHQIGAPIARLSAWAEELSKGNLGRRISLRSNDELAQLANALDHMRGNLKKNLDELFESKERYQSIIGSIDCVVWEAQLNPTKVTLLSGQVKHVLGYSAEELLRELPQWRRHILQDHHQLVVDAFRYATREASDTYVEFKVRHSNGEWVWVKALVSVVIEGLNVVGLRGVVVDIDEIVKASEEMKEARDLAVKTAEDKSRFMSIVSHEIRTPMHGMLGMLDVFNDAGLTDEQREMLDLAKRSGRNLLSLVDDVMDFSRLESGEMEFHFEEVNIHELFNSSVNLVAVDAYRRGLDLGMVAEASLPQRVVVDATKLRQVLTSLLSNAAKFTEHGSIMLWAEMLPDDRLYVEIKDTGVGIAAERQGDLFKPFVQEDVSSTRKFGGSGLGLALCDGLLKAMGGSIGVRSIKEVGSSFFFELPVQVPAGQTSLATRVTLEFAKHYSNSAVLLIGDLPATQMVMQMACQQWGLDFHWEAKESRVIRQLDEVLHSRNYRWIFIAQEISDRFWERLNPYLNEANAPKIIQLRVPTERYGQRPLPHLYVPFSQRQFADCLLGRGEEQAHATSPGVSQNVPLPKVLVVDDNEVNRRVACGYLRKLGFSCDIAEDGLQALEAVKEHHYGLVFMDCQMPVMDGYEATRAIRDVLDGKALPIIAVTANAMEGDREKCLQAGMDDYLAKPLRKDSLQQVVMHWLSPQQAQAVANRPSA
ncbi:response regulator [Ketobacter sp.]|uniref:response regulator n=1 Tax=Ketobacter sp. TaxID=2083498 RepID=UPI0025C1CAAC|nr:response regulator [Ketobacter sp.]